jgi:acyl transferase domain-containing protein
MSLDFKLKNEPADDIAIVGMSGHFPDAPDISQFWKNLTAGVESIRHHSREDLLAAGEAPDLLSCANYVPAAAVLAGFADFDAEFFGFSPKDAAILDPQHRQFLETAWEALENAGHPPESFPGAIGVYAGCGMGSYFYFNLCSNRDLVDGTGMFLLRHTGNDKDFLATRVSHILDLKGPSINVQTACSTSLVAVHFGIQALLRGECDMALCGGVTIELPHGRGYLYTEGEILSPDGHCHAFDHRAQGTVFGSGAGCVALRRARDALRDGDHIWAIIKASAVNNDGAAKAGYLAPSVEGQAQCIAAAHRLAGIDAATIGHVECHGTGTYLGDPIEIAALTEAFRQTTDAVGSCRIGSIKTNIGHLDTAAGIASLIKVALSLYHRQIPPSLGYERPNPALDLDSSPFLVNDRLHDWHPNRADSPLRAGVNALGVGGTNAHAVLEEAPARAASGGSDWPFQPLVISARSRAALDAQAHRLAAHLRSETRQPLADIAWTLKEGRRAFEKRRVVVARDHAQAAELLSGANPRLVFDHEHLGDSPEVIFMFPGGGAQYAGMARDLYETEPVFADWMDRGLALLQPRFATDLRALWLPAPDDEAEADARLKRPSLQLPLIMLTEYALAQLYISWGCAPAALIGHSMGENTAACLAGVLSFEDCIKLVHLRGQLFDTVAAGGMLSVALSEAELNPWLADPPDDDLDIAAINAPSLCVVSGPQAALDRLRGRLDQAGIECQPIAIDIAAHSRMLEPILAQFSAFLHSIPLHAPRLPVISNRSGERLSAAEATDPAYWVAHLRNSVRFARGLQGLNSTPARVYLEMGPGRALSSLARANGIAAHQIIPALRHPDQRIGDDYWHIASIARLWACGVAVDWAPIWGDARRNRVPLPGYAFQRKTYFIEPARNIPAEAIAPPRRIEAISDWGWQCSWRPDALPVEVDGPQAPLPGASDHQWLVFVDEDGIGALTAQRLAAAGAGVTTVRAGDSFSRIGENAYVMNPEHGREDSDLLIADLIARGRNPDRIAHFWLVTDQPRFRRGSSFVERNLEQGFYSLMFLAQAIAAEELPLPLHISVITSGAAQVRSEPLPHPEKATILGPLRVTAQELPGLTLSTLDIELPAATRRGLRPLGLLSDRVLEELLSPVAAESFAQGAPVGIQAALRGTRRYRAGITPQRLPDAALDLPRGLHVLITGGFGGIGLTLAEDLIRRFQARITLLTRQPLPASAEWDDWLRHHPATDPSARRIMALRRLGALGGEIGIAVADVCNAEEMQAARRQAIARFGPIHTLIHAAGVVDDAPLLGKSPAQVQDVLAPKIHGTRVLDSLFPDGSLQQMVLFSSTSTVIGAAGQIDYIAANEYLNAYARARRGDQTRVIALNWGIWTGVGMAAGALAGQDPANLGQATQPPATLPHTTLPPAAPPPAALPPAQAQGEGLFQLPMLGSLTPAPQGGQEFHARYDSSHWFLDGHRTAEGMALLPGTGVVEIAAEALKLAGFARFELADLYFLRPFELDDNGQRGLRARLVPEGGGLKFELHSAVDHAGRSAWQLVAQAQAWPLPADQQAGQIDSAAIAARCGTAETGKGLVTPQERHLRFGARWRVLQSRAFGRGEALAHLALPETFRAEAADFIMHPALMDIATGWAMELIDGYTPGHLWVPVSYGRIRLYRPLGDTLISHIRNAGANHAKAASAVFDIALAKPSGEICAEIEGFTIHRLEGQLARARPADAQELEFDGAALLPRSPAEARLLENYRQGIRPDEGAEAFLRVLACPGPQVIVSSLDLPALVAQMAQHHQPQDKSRNFERPELETDFVAPRNDIESQLANFWQDLLGLARVGIHDDFFALGGHSLIAVRLFAMVKKALRVDFPISVLFEAPTIARCAELIAARTGAEAGPANETAVTQDSRTTAAPPNRQFTHLVAMHEGRPGAELPFFLVAGMFGNVLNLRHLARIIGRDRPFYGLQARGLYGDAPPHASLPDAAMDYITELRQIQPHGPYLLGGFSGGGLTAWEMARQLEAAGEEVALLTLLDTPLPMRPVLSYLDRGLIKIAKLREGGFGYLAEWLRGRWQWERGKYRQPAATAEPNQFHNREIEAAFRAALSGFTLAPYAGRTLLLRPPLERRYAVSGGNWVSDEREYVYHDNDLTRFAPPIPQISAIAGRAKPPAVASFTAQSRWKRLPTAGYTAQAAGRSKRPDLPAFRRRNRP